MSIINVDFDFTTDTPKYWDNYWEKDELFGGGTKDPDNASKTMQLYHKMIYSKPLPNGETMELKMGKGKEYLTWKNFSFGSDSIITSFRYSRYRKMIEAVSETLSDYHLYMENYVRKSYTLGGEIIFPKKTSGINQTRGFNVFIKDRWDLTLECIRRYYENEESPLYDVLHDNKDFFDLFVNFKGYIDFFYLQDCVTDNYEQVIFWLGDGSFKRFPLPETVEEYLLWIEKELEFVEKRNERIRKATEQLELT